MPHSRPIPRRRLITDEPTSPLNYLGRTICSIRGNHPRKQLLARIKPRNPRGPLQVLMFTPRRNPRCERRYMAFPLQSPTFPIVAAAVVALIACLAPGESVQAQTNAPPAIAIAPRLTLTAEQEYIVREIILKDSNVEKQNTAPETVGDVVPADVKLFPLPQDVVQKVPQARSHMFFVKDDAVILVSSSDRRVADVIKRKSTD
jgi:hypothetical protein